MAIPGKVRDLVKLGSHRKVAAAVSKQQAEPGDLVVKAFLSGYLRRSAELGLTMKEAMDRLRACRESLEKSAGKEVSAGFLDTVGKLWSGFQSAVSVPLIPLGLAVGLGAVPGYMMGRFLANMTDYPEQIEKDIAAEELIAEYKKQKELLEQGRKLTF